MSISLLATKLYAPSPRPGLIARPSLLARLDDACANKLILISAPAGFGKSTLLSQWLSQTRPPTAWITLDERDNDPARFIAYLFAAFETVDIIVAEKESSPLQGFGRLHPSQQQVALENALTSLINEIANRDQPEGRSTDGKIRLVLDDYHHISAEPIHLAIAFLLENLPGQMQLVIASRADPPLPVARLRGRGEVTEIRLTDLRFTGAEAGAFFSQGMSLDLPIEVVDTLTETTEGWIAGLQMAALSLRGQPGRKEISHFAQTFKGTNRYILDYLVEEVLEHQPDSIQRFLLETSILTHLNAPLCQAVLAESVDTRSGTSCQDILERLERDNLFIHSLDENRQWYRYHQLFSDLLQKRLRQDHAPDVPALHLRASRWLEQHGFAAEAIEHAFSAEDLELAADLINDQAETAFKNSELSSLLGWIDRLPNELVRQRHDLCLFHAWALLMAGKPLSLVKVRIEEAAVELDPILVAPLRAFITMYQGKFLEASIIAEKALADLPDEFGFLRSMATWTRAMSVITSEDLESIETTLQEIVELGQESGNLLMSVAAVSHLGNLRRRKGELQQAHVIYDRALQLAADSGGNLIPIAGEAMLGLGELWREWNDLEKAASCLEEGIQLNSQLGAITALEGYLSLAMVRQEQGRPEDAHELIETARQIAAQFDASEWDDIIVAAYQARLWIAEGDLDAANKWAEERGLGSEGQTGSFHQIDKAVQEHINRHEQTVLSRLFLAQKQPGIAERIIERLLPQAAAKGRTASLIELYSLQALARQQNGDVEGSMDALANSLSLAEPGGFIRTFVNCGLEMAALLYQAAERDISADYAGRILSCFPDAAFSSPPVSSQLAAAKQIEPLSDRELEVLGLIAEGLTNREIADRLYLSNSTVKVHTYNLYAKLDVHSRTQAANKGRALGLIPQSPA